MTTDTDALTERIYQTWCPSEWASPATERHEQTARELHRDLCWEQARAVLPIIEQEVRKAKAEALREAALDISFIEMEDDYDRLDYSTSREFYEDMVQDWLRGRATEYETGADHE